MNKKKVTSSERRILKAISKVGVFIRQGNWRRTNAEVINHIGLLFTFRDTTFASLLEKKLIKAKEGTFHITALGGDAAIKGYYTPGGDIDNRSNALEQLNN